jgi:transposase
MLKTLLHSLKNIESIMAEVDAEIEERLKEYQVELDLVQTIPGVGAKTAGIILSEIGNDMSAYPSQHHLASWAGMSPGNNESAGKKKLKNNARQQNAQARLSRSWVGSDANEEGQLPETQV